ncbi:MAG: PSD1 domain-containing protein [Planctomycetaceae bacterium]|nr:PSD1 domain-containing protein [Planctomycetaceae bacterium]
MLRLTAMLFVVAGGCASLASAGETVDYLREVKPLLHEKCGACHGAVRQKSGLRLDAGQFIHRGGEDGAAITPGNAAASTLLKRLTAAAAESLMPPEGEGKPLTADEIDLLRRWIDAGAPFPADEPIPADPREHWSFQPVVRPALPAVKQADWIRTPLDTFIAAQLDEQRLTPAPEANRATLLRRVYLDLIGMPPTREQLRAFLADDSPTAYERIVDQLLERPEYGERWGRHWMDVWRYCDWHGSGNEIRYSQRHIWRWRDWIVRSLNADKGYDRMIVEMLAGDEIAPDDPDVVAATGFLGRNWYKFDRNVWMRELVEHTAVGFLGTTLKCARCHDHKFDPISQEEYYRFRAFFEPHHVRVDRVSAATEFESFVDAGPVLKDAVSRVYDKTLDAPTFLFERGDDRYPQRDRALSPGVPQALRGAAIDIQPVSLPLASYAPMLRPAMLAELTSLADKKVTAAEQAWHAAPTDAVMVKRLELARGERRSLAARIAADVAMHVDHAPPERVAELAKIAARAEREAALIDAETKLLEAEAALAALKSVQPQDEKSQQALAAAEKTLAAARQTHQTAQTNLVKTDVVYTPLGEVYPATSTGRRLALARWIADPRNPRTARVAVNQIWLRHFGHPLVGTVADFGLRSKMPTHPELLDWLSAEFVEHGWSMKHLHRLLVMSATYRQSSTFTAGNSGASSPELAQNRWWNRMDSRRLEAEAVRDSVLFIGGALDGTIGGREIPYAQESTVPRRSLYLQTAPNRQAQLLAVFDVASTEECYDRKPSVIPQQSLALLNSSLTANASRQVAARLATLSDAEFTIAAFESVLSREPTGAELARCAEFLQTQARWFADTKPSATLPAAATPPVIANPTLRARENLILVLFNHNDFVTVR